jgi:hypothetical protein
MENIHPIMIIGGFIGLLVLIYGGEQATQRNPLGFMAFFCGSIFIPIIGIITLCSY